MSSLSNYITFIILTHNEANLDTCLRSVKSISNQIVVVDSFSQIKQSKYVNHNVQFYQNKFINQGIQFNWAPDNIQIQPSG